MWDFSDDESCFCFVSAVVVAAAGLPLWVAALRIKLLGRSILRRLFMLALPIVALILTGLVLDRWADPQVLGHADYIALFLLGNAASPGGG